MNLVVGYVRSGNNWLCDRMALFFFKCTQEYTSYAGMLDTNVRFTHASFGNNNADQDFPDVLHLDDDSKIFVLIRDAKAIVSSYFDYMTNSMALVWPELLDVLPADLDSFIRSDWGISRICRYLNGVHRLINVTDRALGFLYYEDAFDKRFLNVLPHIAGCNYKMTEEEIDWIYRNSNFKLLKQGIIDEDVPADIKEIVFGRFSKKHPAGRSRKGKTDSYRKELSLESQEYIDDYLRANCHLEQYLNRYL